MLESHSACHSVIRKEGASTDFHASAAERKLYPPECSRESVATPAANPAPGTYNVRMRLAKGAVQPFASSTPQLCTAQPFESSSQSRGLEPGPGEYSPTPEMSRLAEDAFAHLAFSGLRSTGRREGWFRPALEQPFTNPDFYDGNIPGPGHYAAQPSTIKGYNRARRARSSHRGYQGSPHDYHGIHQPQQLMKLRGSDAGMCSGFSSTESRPCMQPKIKTEQEAGPATYDRHLAAGQSVEANLRHAAKVGKGGAFCSSKAGDRFAKFGSCKFALDGKTIDGRPRSWSPAPHDYKEALPKEMQMSVSGVDASGGGFRSGVPQLPPDYRVDNLPKPGPGEYEARGMAGPSLEDPLQGLPALPPSSPGHSQQGSPIKSRSVESPTAGPSFMSTAEPSYASTKSSGSTRSFRKPKTEHLSFGSSQSRPTLGGVRSAVTPGWKASKTPGPGNYEPSAARARGFGGGVKATEDRYLEPPAERNLRIATTILREPFVDPGPGAYDLDRELHRKKDFNTSGDRAARILMQNATKIAEKVSSPKKLFIDCAAGGNQAWREKPRGSNSLSQSRSAPQLAQDSESPDSSPAGAASSPEGGGQAARPAPNWNLMDAPVPWRAQQEESQEQQQPEAAATTAEEAASEAPAAASPQPEQPGQPPPVHQQLLPQVAEGEDEEEMPQAPPEA